LTNFFIIDRVKKRRCAISTPKCAQCGWPQVGCNYFCPQCGARQPLPATVGELIEKQGSDFEEWHDVNPESYHQEISGKFCTKCGKKLK
jgi:hypothetical protein